MPFPHHKFRRRREELGLSRATVAEAAGIAPRYMELLEQGKRPNPTQDTLEGLCRALDVKCDFFFGPDDPPSPPPPPGRPPKHKPDTDDEQQPAAGEKQSARRKKGDAGPGGVESAG